jgi:hypothetical protein
MEKILPGVLQEVTGPLSATCGLPLLPPTSLPNMLPAGCFQGCPAALVLRLASTYASYADCRCAATEPLCACSAPSMF